MTRTTLGRLFSLLQPITLAILLCPPGTSYLRLSNNQLGRGGTTDAVRQSPTPPSQCSNLGSAPAIFGVTITKLKEASAAHEKLGALAAINPAVPLVVRVVFEPIQMTEVTAFETELNSYKSAVDTLRGTSGACIMGAIADSDFMHFYLRESMDPSWPDGYGNYQNWTRRLIQKMGDAVDIWEVGNEVNGEWYGWEGHAYKKDENETDANQDPAMSKKRADMRARVRSELDAAYSIVKRLRPSSLTAVTLLYNDDGQKDCTEFHEYKMGDWVSNYLTGNILGGVDFVLLSYYENKQDCPKVTRSPDKLLANVFVPLRRMFGSDKTAFGFGEISYKQNCYKNKDEEYDDDDRNNHKACREGQKDYVTRYYKKLDRELAKAVNNYNKAENVNKIKFVGGYFYWYFLQDMVLADSGKDNSVYDALRDARESFRPPEKPKRTGIKVN